MPGLWFMCDLLLAIIVTDALTQITNGLALFIPLGVFIALEAPRGRKRIAMSPLAGVFTKTLIWLGGWLWRILTTDSPTSRLNWDDAKIDAMQGEEFEQFLGTLFRLRGWHVTFTAKTGDQGADLIIARGPTKIAIQAKRYSHAVGNDAVQQVLGGKAYYECNHAIVITSNTFTKAARNLAQRARIGLWDREILKREVGTLSPELRVDSR